MSIIVNIEKVETPVDRLQCDCCGDIGPRPGEVLEPKDQWGVLLIGSDPHVRLGGRQANKLDLCPKCLKKVAKVTRAEAA